MALDYINNGIDDPGIYKGKIDESVNLLRKPPVSSTTGGGVEGINYTVADWTPLILTSGRIYTARIHTSSIGAYTINGVTCLRPNGDLPGPLDIQAGGVYSWRVDGANLIQSVLPRYVEFEATRSTGPDSWTRVCRIRLTEAFTGSIIRLSLISRTSGASNYTLGNLSIKVRQQAALGNDPTATLLVSNLEGGDTVIGAGSFAAYFSTVSVTETVVDVYFTSNGSPSADLSFLPLHIESGSIETSQVTFFSNAGVDTEANITGGLGWDAVSTGAALQSAGSPVVTDADIGSTVQPYDPDILFLDDIGSLVQAQNAKLQDLADNLTATAAQLNDAVAAGTILQRIVSTKTDAAATNSTTSYSDVGISVSITPKYANSLLEYTFDFNGAVLGTGGSQASRTTNIAITDNLNTLLALKDLQYTVDPASTAALRHDFPGSLKWIEVSGGTSAITRKIRHRAFSANTQSTIQGSSTRPMVFTVTEIKQ